MSTVVTQMTGATNKPVSHQAPSLLCVEQIWHLTTQHPSKPLSTYLQPSNLKQYQFSRPSKHPYIPPHP